MTREFNSPNSLKEYLSKPVYHDNGLFIKDDEDKRRERQEIRDKDPFEIPRESSIKKFDSYNIYIIKDLFEENKEIYSIESNSKSYYSKREIFSSNQFEKLGGKKPKRRDEYINDSYDLIRRLSEDLDVSPKSKWKSNSLPPITPLTPEELEAQERERVLSRRRYELSTRFGTQVPNDLTEEEMERLFDEQVEPLSGRWFLFFRRQGRRFEFPESMNGQFSAMMDASARSYVEQQYHVSTQLPLDKLWDITSINLGEQPTGRVIQIAEGAPTHKNFPLGKIYETVPISGLRERVSPLEATTLLVYGLIGKKRNNVQAAYKAFEKGKLEAARRDLRNSHLSREGVFREIAPYLAQLSQGDANAAEQILKYFSESVKTEDVSDLVEGIRGMFRQESGFSHLDFKMQDGVYQDLFDNSRLMSCTFLPNGLYKEATLAYHSDPDVGLLHVTPRDLDRILDPIGVAILLNATDENGRKWLVVDSVEGGSDLSRVREKLWMPAVYNGIVGVARDVDASNVLFNSRVHNGRPRAFVSRTFKDLPSTTVRLKKSGTTDYSSLGINSDGSKEAFETWGENGREGEATGYVLEIKK